MSLKSSIVFVYFSCYYLQVLILKVYVFVFPVCAVRVIAESDIVQDFLASEDNVVSIHCFFSKCFVSKYNLCDI